MRSHLRTADLLPVSTLGLRSRPGRAALSILGVAIGIAGSRVAGNQARMRRLVDDLQAHKDHLSSILDTVPDAMVVIDEHGVIQSFSSAAERQFGWKAEEVVGANVDRLMPEPYRSAHDGYLRRYLQTGVRRIIGIGRVVVGERKDGSTFPASSTVVALRSREGKVTHFVGVQRDITDELKLRDQLVHSERLSAVGELVAGSATWSVGEEPGHAQAVGVGDA